MSESILQSHRTCDFKGDFTGVNIVEASIKNNRLHVNHWETGNNSIFHFFFNTLFNWRNIFSWNCSTFDFTLKFKAFTSTHWLNPKQTVSILSSASGLSNVFSFSFTSFLDSFFVSNLWSSRSCNNVKL